MWRDSCLESEKGGKKESERAVLLVVASAGESAVESVVESVVATAGPKGSVTAAYWAARRASL